MPDSNQQPRFMESHVLPSQPRTLNNRQALDTNKSETRCYEISKATNRDYSKMPPKQNFYFRVRLEKSKIKLIFYAR